MLTYLRRFIQMLPGKSRDIFMTCAYGLGAGLAAVAFQKAITLLFSHSIKALSSDESLWVVLGGTFAVIIGSSLIVGFLLTHYCQDARGSGIPQLKLAFWKDFGAVSWRVVWVKFVAGVLSVGGGCSLGREGPSVHLAAGLSSNMAGWFGEPKQHRRTAAAAGAAAGLAAAFNTPLAAVTFVLEEVVQDLNSRILGSVLLASVIGAFVVHGLIGQEPAFYLTSDGAPSFQDYLMTPVVASVAALVGVAFQRLTLGLRMRRKGFERVPLWVRPAIGAAITWVLGMAIFMNTGRLGVFGLGYEDLSAALNEHLEWKIAGLLLVAKLIATFTCYGFGSCGGIFAPTLFFGGMCGLFLSGLFSTAFEMSGADHTIMAVVGMSACLGAVVRAPVTGILIVFEMTHDFALVPALMLGALISQAVSRRINKHNFYDALLLQDGHNLEHVIPPRDLQTWQQLPISAIANFQPTLALDQSPAGMKQLLKQYPYRRFPVIENDRLKGILTREEGESAIQEERLPVLETAVTTLPNGSIRELQSLLIESTTSLVVLTDRPDGKVIALVTLHDLLRAEVSIVKGARDLT